ncbi:ABC transporter permease [Arachidicoccus ginsenosidimutans]|uniref:ABC transporter permease n=1 Tax=Arachidicoccus sp. BS20 TaxID=1850526 RepID=UPI0012E75999|nr:ABC transporter permease [Arachidicoccus sp. BS20]
MLKNYFLIALRSFKKDKTNALISLSGLIVGLTCVMLIVGYIRYETSFDTSYSNSDRIYRVISDDKRGNAQERSGGIPDAFGATAAREIPEIEAQTPIVLYNKNVLIKNEYVQIKACRADSLFFQIFNFQFLYGDSKTALSNVNNVVIAQSLAKKIYGTDNAVGKDFNGRGNDKHYIVAAVVKDIPSNSFMTADAFFLDQEQYGALDVSSGYSETSSFILLSKNASVTTLSQKIKQLCHKYNMDNFHFEFQPVQKIHLHSSDIKDQGNNYRLGDIKYIYIYGCIALLILIIGCINFINLTIARSLERTKEVGVRKVFGAQKVQLILQFIGESLLYFAIAIPVAFLLAYTLWQAFTSLLNIQADISFLMNIGTLLIIIGICVFSTLLSSWYPAFFLSRLEPVSSLRGGRSNGFRVSLGLRKSLIVIQFTISIMLIVATIVVHTQLSYLDNAPLGFNKNNLLTFSVPYGNHGSDAFTNKLLQNSDIQLLTFSGLHIANYYGGTSSMDNPKDSTKQLNFAFIDADFNFVKTFQIPIIEGRDFSTKHPSDIIDYNALEDIEEKKNEVRKKNHEPMVNFLETIEPNRPVIVSENLVKAIGLENPIEQRVHMGAFQGTIIGIIKDFRGMSLKEENPFIVIRCYSNEYAGQAYLRINATNTNATINYISKQFKQFFPKDKFDFSFVDDRIAHLYDLEIRLTKLFNIFAFLAIIISCTGLFSLVSLMVRKRTKEIGIRKIMGASVKDIVLLISKDFIRLIIISFIIATPLAYIAMNKWLQGYANKTKIYWWIFAIAGVVAFIIAFASIGFKSVAAAKANPVDSLRDE